jgi:hypothetical protein
MSGASEHVNGTVGFPAADAQRNAQCPVARVHVRPERVGRL